MCFLSRQLTLSRCLVNVPFQLIWVTIFIPKGQEGKVANALSTSAFGELKNIESSDHGKQFMCQTILALVAFQNLMKGGVKF